MKKGEKNGGMDMKNFGWEVNGMKELRIEGVIAELPRLNCTKNS